MSLSRRLAYILRHNPSSVGMTLEKDGWLDLGELAAKLEVDLATIEKIVTSDIKGRYQIAGGKIRAVQGHSAEVEMEFTEAQPPELLYHGTPLRSLESIRTQGLRKMRRHHVHLSSDTETAEAVGARRGEATVLSVQAAKMHSDGYLFYRSVNGVWLTEQVPARYIR